MFCVGSNNSKTPRAPRDLRWWELGEVQWVSDSYVVLNNRLHSFEPTAPAHLTPVASTLHLQVTQVHQAQHACAVLTKDGEVYTWTDAQIEGSSFFKGPAFRNREPQRALGGLEGKVVVSLSVGCHNGGASAAAVTNEGELYTWGASAGGVLCHGDLVPIESPQRVEFFSRLPVQFVSNSGGRLIVITVGGFLYLSGLSHWEMQSLKTMHEHDWEVYCGRKVGNNSTSTSLNETQEEEKEGGEGEKEEREKKEGEKEGEEEEKEVPAPPSVDISLDLSSTHSKQTCGLARRIGTPSRIEVGNGKRFVHAAVCHDRAAAVTDGGVLYAWALEPNAAAILGHDCKLVTEPAPIATFSNNNRKVTKVWMTALNSAALTNKGRLWTWGMKDSLGHPAAKTHKTTPKKILSLTKHRIVSVFWNIRFGVIISSNPAAHTGTLPLEAVLAPHHQPTTTTTTTATGETSIVGEERGKKRSKAAAAAEEEEEGEDVGEKKRMALASIENLGQC